MIITGVIIRAKVSIGVTEGANRDHDRDKRIGSLDRKISGGTRIMELEEKIRSA